MKPRTDLDLRAAEQGAAARDHGVQDHGARGHRVPSRGVHDGGACDISARDGTLALLLGAVCALSFLLLAQGRLWGDGSPLFELAVFESRPW